MQPLLVTGLPGSRLSWLANYFSDVRPCAHALSMEVCGEAYHEVLARDFIGNADPYLLVTDTLERYADAPVVLVKRHTDEAHAYAQARGAPIDPNAMLLMLHAIVEAVDAQQSRWFVVQYKDIDIALPDMCKHLGVPYNRERHSMLAQYDIHAKRTTRLPDGVLAGWLEYHNQRMPPAEPVVLDATGAPARAGLGPSRPV